jgi:pseudouridine synthase
VRVRGVPDALALQALREGVAFTRDQEQLSRPAQVRVLGAARSGTWLEVVLTEGKNRQLRRMCAAVGHDVEALVRVAIGGLALGELAPGAWRRLDPEEVERLTRGAAAPRSAGRRGGAGGAGPPPRA